MLIVFQVAFAVNCICEISALRNDNSCEGTISIIIWVFFKYSLNVYISFVDIITAL